MSPARELDLWHGHDAVQLQEGVGVVGGGGGVDHGDIEGVGDGGDGEVNGFVFVASINGETLASKWGEVPMPRLNLGEPVDSGLVKISGSLRGELVQLVNNLIRAANQSGWVGRGRG